MTGLRSGAGPWLFGVVALMQGVTPGLSAGQDFQVAPGAWSLEQFGTDVAVLRSSSTPDQSGAVSLLLSCSAEDRRIRVSFPVDLAARAAQTGGGGSALIGAVGSSRVRGGTVVRFKVANRGTLVVGTSTTGPDDPVTRLAAMLATGAHDLDLLLSWGSAPVVLTRLDVYRLSMRGAAPDKSDVTHFITACRRIDATAGPLTK